MSYSQTQGATVEAALSRAANAVALLRKASTNNWNNTPAQINARANLSSFKVRSAGVPDRFTRGAQRKLQSAVLRANAMARATKTDGYDESKHPRKPRADVFAG